MKEERDRNDLYSHRPEDGHTGKQPYNSGKCHSPLVGPCWNVTKHETLLDKPFHAHSPRLMEGMMVRSTFTPSGLERPPERSFLRQ